MSIKAISQVTLTNKIQNQSKSNPTKTTSLQTGNSYQLPSYHVSFGMARIDLEKLKTGLYERDIYFKTDEDGNIPARAMDEEMLKATVDKLNNTENAVYVFDLFKTKNPLTGELIAHSPKEGVLKVMSESLLKHPNGEEILKKIYLTPDNHGCLPVHTFSRLEDHKEMARFFNNAELAEIYTTETKNQKLLPSDIAKKDGVNAYIIELFEDNTDKTLKEIFLHENNNHNEHPKLNGPKDMKAFLKAFNDNDVSLENYFIESYDEKYFSREFLSSSIFPSETIDMLNQLHSQLIGSFPHLLKDIYTLPILCSTSLKNQLHDNIKPDYAKNIMDLITNSDLDLEDSLEVLEVNKEFLEEQNIEDLDIVEDYLKNAIKKQ